VPTFVGFAHFQASRQRQLSAAKSGGVLREFLSTACGAQCRTMRSGFRLSEMHGAYFRDSFRRVLVAGFPASRTRSRLVVEIFCSREQRTFEPLQFSLVGGFHDHVQPKGLLAIALPVGSEGFTSMNAGLHSRTVLLPTSVDIDALTDVSSA
jgi:hypothetical protein